MGFIGYCSVIAKANNVKTNNPIKSLKKFTLDKNCGASISSYAERRSGKGLKGKHWVNVDTEAGHQIET